MPTELTELDPTQTKLPSLSEERVKEVIKMGYGKMSPYGWEVSFAEMISMGEEILELRTKLKLAEEALISAMAENTELRGISPDSEPEND